jgi:hypothetical protein
MYGENERRDTETRRKITQRKREVIEPVLRVIFLCISASLRSIVDFWARNRSYARYWAMVDMGVSIGTALK